MRLPLKLAFAAAGAALLGLIAPLIAFAHDVVLPRTSAPGRIQRYVLRASNERTVSSTRVEIRFPPEVRVTSFEKAPGWRLEVLSDSAKRILGAVWTGSLSPQRFVEFPFRAANPAIETEVVWPTLQTYADDEVVAWTGAEGSNQPASTTSIRSPSVVPSGAQTPLVSWTALAVALIATGLALRPRTQSA